MIARAALALAGLLAAALPSVAGDRALIIGINSYPGILVNGVPNQRNLHGAVNDARTMADLAVRSLGYPREGVLLLTDDKATGPGILEAMRRHLVEGTRPGDRVLFYYAGHGAQDLDDNADEEDGLDEVLVPHDAVTELARPEEGIANVLRDETIGAILDELGGREVMVIVDACHSGTITRAALAARSNAPAAGYSPVRTLTPFGPPRLSTDLGTRSAHRRKTGFVGTTRGMASRAVWSAVNSAQFALEDMSIGGSAGLFTSRFVRGIGDLAADRNGNGRVTAAELLGYLRHETTAYCESYDCLGQDPMPTLEAYDGYEAAVLNIGDNGANVLAMADLPSGDNASFARTSTGGDPGSGTAGDVAPVAAPVTPPADAKEAVTLALATDILPETPTETVKVEIAGGNKVKVGGTLRLAITAPTAGRLIVIDRRDDGSTYQLFPNEISAAAGVSDLVAAGETVMLPGEGALFELVADKPGRGEITALVVDPAADIGALLSAFDAFEPIPDADAYAAKLASAVSRAIVFKPSGTDAAAANADAPMTEEALAIPARAAAETLRGGAPYEILP